VIRRGPFRCLSLTLSGKPGDRSVNFHTVTLNHGLSRHLQEVLGIDGHPEEHACLSRRRPRVDTFNAIRHENELARLSKLIAEERKQMRRKGYLIVYVIPDDAEHFGNIFLYRLVVKKLWL